MAEELRKDRSLPKYAQAITLYHLIVEGSLAQPGQHFIEDFFASEETMPGFSAGMANVSRDEQRHIGFGVKVLSELLAEGSPLGGVQSGGGRAAARSRCPTGRPSSTRPNMDREYTECYGFSLEDIFAFGLKLIRQRWRTIGYPTEEMPPGVFPFDPEMSEEEVAERQVKLLKAGVLGQPDGGARILAGAAAPLLRRDRPRRRPGRRQRLAGRLPVALHRRRALAPDHRQRLDPGRAGRGARTPTSTSRRAGRDWIASATQAGTTAR